MTRPLAVLRPEPGNAATAARIEASGATAIRLPLFAVRPIAWIPPDADRYRALLLTSANAVRHGGAALDRFRSLPVFAVGEATAAAARAAGLHVERVGSGGAGDLLATLDRAELAGLLHLTGREHSASLSDNAVESIPVYASDPIAPIDLTPLAGAVALLHSPRAAARLASLAGDQALDRRTVRIAAISTNTLAAAGERWAGTAIAITPSDAALIDAGLTLARD